MKIFPSELTGPKYIKALRAPLPQIRMMPTGGVNLDTAEEFLKAGAVHWALAVHLSNRRLLRQAT